MSARSGFSVWRYCSKSFRCSGLIGNKIGNNWDNKSKADECRIETVTSAVPYNAPVVIGYQITGRLKDGTIAYVTRDFKPELGELITVNTRVW